MTKIQSLVAALLAASPLIGVTAYPKEATWSRELQQSVAGRDQDAANPKTRELQDRAAIRRSLTAQLLRQKRDIVHSEDTLKTRVVNSLTTKADYRD